MVTPKLSRREREVMDIVHRHERCTAVEIRRAMAAPPTDAAVRSTLRILVSKGELRIEQDGPRYAYSPMAPQDEARRSALEHVMETFFDGSAEGAMAALLDMKSESLGEEARRRLKAMIDEAAEEGR